MFPRQPKMPTNTLVMACTETVFSSPSPPLQRPNSTHVDDGVKEACDKGEQTGDGAADGWGRASSEQGVGGQSATRFVPAKTDAIAEQTTPIVNVVELKEKKVRSGGALKRRACEWGSILWVVGGGEWVSG
jgi:hypothetical protein